VLSLKLLGSQTNPRLTNDRLEPRLFWVIGGPVQKSIESLASLSSQRLPEAQAQRKDAAFKDPWVIWKAPESILRIQE
jgi:hypothetical protein